MMKKYSAKVEVELNIINYTLKNQGEQAQLMTPMDQKGGLLGTGQAKGTYVVRKREVNELDGIDLVQNLTAARFAINEV